MLSPLALTLAPMALALHRARLASAEPFCFESAVSVDPIEAALRALLAAAPRYVTLRELAVGLGWRPTRDTELRLARMLRALGWRRGRLYSGRGNSRPHAWRAA